MDTPVQKFNTQAQLKKKIKKSTLFGMGALYIHFGLCMPCAWEGKEGKGKEKVPTAYNRYLNPPNKFGIQLKE